MRFDVMYTLDNVRDFQEFSTKTQAMKFALKMRAKGAEKIFVDTYDDDDDLVDYKNILEDGAWITRKNPSKYKNTLAFNKNDQDSIANPANKPIVPFRGINKKWGLGK